MYRQSEKNLLNSNISLVNVGLQTAEICSGVWGKFQWVSRLGCVTAPTSCNGSQPNFAWYFAVSWFV